MIIKLKNLLPNDYSENSQLKDYLPYQKQLHELKLES